MAAQNRCVSRSHYRRRPGFPVLIKTGIDASARERKKGGKCEKLMTLIKEFCVFITKRLSLFSLHLAIGRPELQRMQQCGRIKWGGKNLIHGHIKCLRKDEKGKERKNSNTENNYDKSLNLQGTAFLLPARQACPFA